jgi:hypothetical protein
MISGTYKITVIQGTSVFANTIGRMADPFFPSNRPTHFDEPDGLLTKIVTLFSIFWQGSPLRSQDPQRHTLPSSGNGERRLLARCAAGEQECLEAWALHQESSGAT